MTTLKRFIFMGFLLVTTNSSQAMLNDETRHYDIQSLLNTIKADVLNLVLNKGINFTQPIKQTSPLARLAYLEPLALDYPQGYLSAFFDDIKISLLEYVELFDSCIGTFQCPPDCIRKIVGLNNFWDESTGQCLQKWWQSRGKDNALAELDNIQIFPGSHHESIAINNLNTGELIRTEKLLPFWRKACVKLDNYHLASGSTDNTIKIWALRMDLSLLQRLLISHLQKVVRNNETINVHDDWSNV